MIKNGKQHGYSIWAFLVTLLILLLLGMVITQKVIADKTIPKKISYVPSIQHHAWAGNETNAT